MSTSYEMDIRPLFRPQDIRCMERASVSLDAAAWMLDPAGDGDFADHAHARLVGKRIVSRTMPPDAPWPAEQIALYQDWMTGGFQP